jgi:hypothetical protein
VAEGILEQQAQQEHGLQPLGLQLLTCGVDRRRWLAPQCGPVVAGDQWNGRFMMAMRSAMMRSGARVALALLAVAGLCAVPAAAAPLRVSLHGLDDPGPVTTVPGSTAPARFVAATDAPVPAPAPSERRPADDEPGHEAVFVPTHELPQGDAVPGLALPRPDEAGGVAQLLDGAGAVVVAPSAGERALGEFVPPPPATTADAIDGPPADAETVPDLPLVDLDALRQQRLAIMIIVLPMVLAAVAVWWWVDRGRRHLRRSHRSHRNVRRGVRARQG